MKKLTFTLGIGLNMFFAELFSLDEPVKKHQSHYYEPKRR